MTGPPTDQIIEGDCFGVMLGWPSHCVDAILTDPPYGLEFMGKGWDHGVPGELFWSEVLRVTKPGGHLLAFGGTRTHHRLMCAIEDAGFEIRDCLMWLYGQGFPKSLDVSKAIDKAAGAKREVVGSYIIGGTAAKGKQKGRAAAAADEGSAAGYTKTLSITAPATPEAQQWQGWGTALKPGWEPVILARKPLSEKTVAANVLKWGTGGLNVDGCRIEAAGDYKDGGARYGESAMPQMGRHQTRPWVQKAIAEKRPVKVTAAHPQGRWPANVLLDEEAGALLGSPSRFFYCAKASRHERGEDNKHPTVKPLRLMAYLCRLTTPPNGIVLDPFAGSGSTCMAARDEGFRFIGIEKEAEYCEIARARLAGDAPLVAAELA